MQLFIEPLKLNQDKSLNCVRYFGHNDKKLSNTENWYQRNEM